MVLINTCLKTLGNEGVKLMIVFEQIKIILNWPKLTLYNHVARYIMNTSRQKQ